MAGLQEPPIKMPIDMAINMPITATASVTLPHTRTHVPSMLAGCRLPVVGRMSTHVHRQVVRHADGRAPVPVRIGPPHRRFFLRARINPVPPAMSFRTYQA